MPPAVEPPLPAKSGPVTLRLGDLEPEVQRRRRSGESAASVVRRDLERYYRVLRDAAQREAQLRPPEADALAVVARYLDFDASSYRYLWAEVESQLDLQLKARRPSVSPGHDWKAFVGRLKELSAAATMALIDRLETYAELTRDFGWESPVDDAMVAAGLIEAERLAWWRERQLEAARRDGHVIASADQPVADAETEEPPPTV